MKYSIGIGIILTLLVLLNLTKRSMYCTLPEIILDIDLIPVTAGASKPVTSVLTPETWVLAAPELSGRIRQCMSKMSEDSFLTFYTMMLNQQSVLEPI